MNQMQIFVHINFCIGLQESHLFVSWIQISDLCFESILFL